MNTEPDYAAGQFRQYPPDLPSKKQQSEPAKANYGPGGPGAQMKKSGKDEDTGPVTTGQDGSV